MKMAGTKSEAQKRADAKYKRQHVKQVTLTFYDSQPEHQRLLDHLNKQENRQQYLRELIAADMDADKDGSEFVEALEAGRDSALQVSAERQEAAKMMQERGYKNEPIQDALLAAYQAGRAQAFDDVLQRDCQQPGRFTQYANMTILGQLEEIVANAER